VLDGGDGEEKGRRRRRSAQGCERDGGDGELDGEVVGVILCGGALVRFGPAHLLFFTISAFVSFLFSFFFPFLHFKNVQTYKTKTNTPSVLKYKIF
jgi:hypothetical protein